MSDSCAPAMWTYTGANPGADTNAYVLFDSRTFPPRTFSYMGFTRINVSLYGDVGEGGTLRLTRFLANLTGQQVVHDDVVVFAANEAQVYDYQTGLYDHFLLEFVNDGNAKTLFIAEGAMMPEHTPTQ